MTEAEQVFTHILNCDRTVLYLERDAILNRSACRQAASVFKRRVAGEPLAYILGRQEFMGLEFMVDPRVLIPRMETEILVETAIEYAAKVQSHKDARLKILDIGTGSGNIAVSLAKFLPLAGIYATDVSREALEVAGKNACRNKVDDRIVFIHSDLFGHSAAYDLILSNPPYIAVNEFATLQPEVLREPRIALDGGGDGLDFYRRIIAEAPHYLQTGGVLLAEIGFGRRNEVENILRESGRFEVAEVVKDYSGIDRVIAGRLR